MRSTKRVEIDFNLSNQLLFSFWAICPGCFLYSLFPLIYQSSPWYLSVFWLMVFLQAFRLNPKIPQFLAFWRCHFFYPNCWPSNVMNRTYRHLRDDLHLSWKWVFSFSLAFSVVLAIISLVICCYLADAGWLCFWLYFLSLRNFWKPTTKQHWLIFCTLLIFSLWFWFFKALSFWIQWPLRRSVFFNHSLGFHHDKSR